MVDRKKTDGTNPRCNNWSSNGIKIVYLWYPSGCCFRSLLSLAFYINKLFELKCSYKISSLVDTVVLVNGETWEKVKENKMKDIQPIKE